MMDKRSNRCNGLAHVPTCARSPPAWLTSATPPAPSTPPRVTATQPELPAPPPDITPWDLSEEMYERWEERTCIMHYDGKIPWRRAEVLALADVLGQNNPLAGQGETGPAPETVKAEQPV